MASSSGARHGCVASVRRAGYRVKPVAMLLLDLCLNQVGIPDEGGCETAGGPLIKVARTALLHDASLVHEDDAVAHDHRLSLVMRDIKRRPPQPALQRQEFEPHALAQAGIEVGQRLVEEQ